MKAFSKKAFVATAVAVLVLFSMLAAYLSLRLSFPRPYFKTVKGSGVEPALAYAVMKAESGFNEKAVSKAGAVGVMQLLPSTAEFICERLGVEYQEARLKEGEYNAALGCSYLVYLFGRFSERETAICAYNAGEGTVAEWLKNPSYSPDGQRLKEIPYEETREYLKKILKFKKIYENLYG